MRIDQYQRSTGQFRRFEKHRAIEYLGLGLSSEAGEVAGVIKKYIRGDYAPHELKEKVFPEISDVFWYLSELCNELHIDIKDALDYNIEKLQSRKERGKIKGDGDNR